MGISKSFAKELGLITGDEGENWRGGSESIQTDGYKTYENVYDAIFTETELAKMVADYGMRIHSLEAVLQKVLPLVKANALENGDEYDMRLYEAVTSALNEKQSDNIELTCLRREK